MEDLLRNFYAESPARGAAMGDENSPYGIYKEEFEEITLEDFLARAGPETEDDSPSAPVFMQPQVEGPMVRFAADASTGDRYPQNNQQLLLVDGSFAREGKRKLVADPVDKASQQRQKRMIKNRESAARSRERKQAYIQQLETLAARLEEENATMREEQLMENLIPVVEKERPPPPRLRRTCSAQW
ncbi:unnamed protein product [Spirodela intermedia]|uniref:BZIP domain-containing protein n=1 Tax=Spirodela intermedia TaxID=51605 RepID=A0A7I8IRG3_SPIIN|nr:unnamed protein product [Spirodela intermedia]CAA6660542.1 unnamed protein product [Spirodela intermedia]